MKPYKFQSSLVPVMPCQALQDRAKGQAPKALVNATLSKPENMKREQNTHENGKNAHIHYRKGV